MRNKERSKKISRLAQKRFHKKTRSERKPDQPHVWYIPPFGEIVTEPLTVLWFPGQKLIMLGGSLEKSKMIVKEAGADMPDAPIIRETNGLKGLAKTDPEWNGEPTFQCGHCDLAHDVDENVAEVLYQRFQSQSPKPRANTRPSLFHSRRTVEIRHASQPC